jgi:acyl-CoA reductase-like NAD-dependent aldehyde dehydrogenase
MSPQEILERVSTAWIEGRLENVLERQKELAALHTQLTEDSRAIIQAVRQGKPRLHGRDPRYFIINTTFLDRKLGEELISAELTATLDGINTLYEQLDFHDVLARERDLKNGVSSASFFAPLGTTLVVQLPSSPVISVIGPLAAALAAGCPAIILSSSTTPNTNTILRQIVWNTLDRDAFHFETSVDSATHEAFTQASYAIAVLPDLKISKITSTLIRVANPAIRIIEPYHGIPAGFIDRSAKEHLDAAVGEIRRASAAGVSCNPYRVPRLFFVDESVIDSLKEKLGIHAEEGKDLESWLTKSYQHLVGGLSAAGKLGDRI